MTNPWLNPSLLQHTGVDPLKQQLVLKIDTELRSQAAEWIEYKTPDGRAYYYHSKTQKSVWEKPEILNKFEGNICLWDLCFRKFAEFFVFSNKQQRHWRN